MAAVSTPVQPARTPARARKPTRNRVPGYRRHRQPDGRQDLAFVELDGRRIYLGAYGKPESRAEYDRRIAEYVANGRRLKSKDQVSGPATIAALAALWYEKEAKDRELDPRGREKRNNRNVLLLLRPLIQCWGHLPPADFDVPHLDAVIESMVQGAPEHGREPWRRQTVNSAIAVMRRMFKRAKNRKWIPASVYDAIRDVEPLAAGRTEAEDYEVRQPVPIARVSAIRPYVSRQVWALIQLQLWTGARPGELVGLRAQDIDTSRPVWVADLKEHKNAHRGQPRPVPFIGPAQDILRAFMTPDRLMDAPLFSAAEAEAERKAKLREARKSPIQPSQVDRSKATPKRKPGERYSEGTYCRAILRACDKACPLPERLRGPDRKLTPAQLAEREELRKAFRWCPYQLRHTAATWIEEQLGWRDAQMVLGHKHGSKATERYVKADALAAFERFGKSFQMPVKVPA